ncbi:MAG: divergent PAP2 family protein [Cyanobacteria bacterium P01_H01_bin.121]
MLESVTEILHNQVLVVALLACGLAQVLKLVFEAMTHGKFNPLVLVETGGMPSSHSALVAALATAVGQTIGWSSTEFAVATIFAIIVMYDAAGIRQAAGLQAKVLNQIMDRMVQTDSSITRETLKELLGHTRLQVFVGASIGVAIALIAGSLLHYSSIN